MILSNANRTLVILKPGLPAEGLDKDHWDFPITVTNTSRYPLRNAVASITIEYDEKDTRENPDILTDRTLVPGRPITLSWSAGGHGENKQYLDIPESSAAVLNVFRRHITGDQTHLLQAASENGFFNPSNKQRGGLLLNGSKDYYFAITLIADNMLPIIEIYKFDLITADRVTNSETQFNSTRLCCPEQSL